MCISQQYSYCCCCCYHYSIVITWIYFVKSIDQTPPLDVHISCKTFAASTLIIFSHAFKTESFLILPLVESINSRTIARFVRVSSLDVALLIFITRWKPITCPPITIKGSEEMRRNNSGSRSAWYRDLQRFKTSRMSDTDGNNSSFFEAAEVEPKHGFSIVSHARLAAFLAFSSTSGTSGPFSRYSKGEKSFPLSKNPKMRSHLSFCCVTTPSCFREKRSSRLG